MRWITFLMLLYLSYALQVAHLGALLLGHTPDDPFPAIEYLPLLAIFYALFATDTAAPMAALFCGLAYDVGNKDFAGTTMIPLALVALAIVKVRLSIFRDHAATHAVITFLGILLFAGLSALFRRMLGAPLYGASFWAHFLHLAGNALYTALLAPPAFWLLFRFPKLLGFTPQGPRHSGRR
jgi:rod shape-determining protein MreD